MYFKADKIASLKYVKNVTKHIVWFHFCHIYANKKLFEVKLRLG